MPERTPSEQLWADLDHQLLALPHEHLAKVCAHLIRTYIIENRSSARANPAPAVSTPSERTAAANVAPPVPSATTREVESAPAQTSPERRRSKSSDEKKYNKLEMD